MFHTAINPVFRMILLVTYLPLPDFMIHGMMHKLFCSLVITEKIYVCFEERPWVFLHLKVYQAEIAN